MSEIPANCQRAIEQINELEKPTIPCIGCNGPVPDIGIPGLTTLATVCDTCRNANPEFYMGVMMGLERGAYLGEQVNMKAYSALYDEFTKAGTKLRTARKEGRDEAWAKAMKEQDRWVKIGTVAWVCMGILWLIQWVW